MKFLNKYLITFLASGLIILPAFSAVATILHLQYWKTKQDLLTSLTKVKASGIGKHSVAT
jgi:hypothetical protein